MLVDVANFQLNANSDKNLITAAANDFIGPCTQSYRFLIRVTANISLDVGTTYVNKCKSKKSKSKCLPLWEVEAEMPLSCRTEAQSRGKGSLWGSSLWDVMEEISPGKNWRSPLTHQGAIRGLSVLGGACCVWPRD